MSTNDQLVLICGESASGKSASLRNLENPGGVLYLNCEAGKRTPFPSKFVEQTITNPTQVQTWVANVEKPEFSKCWAVVVDSLTYLMDMYESLHVRNAEDGRIAWGNYQHFFKDLMHKHVANSTKSIIFTAHTLNIMNDQEKILEKKVPIKGALKNTGLESYFTVVVAAKKVQLHDLEGYENDLLNITPEDEALGIKYVYQTRITKETVHERIRAPLGMWDIKETFIDNDANLLMKRLQEFYS